MEQTFFEMFPEAKNFYLGLKMIALSGEEIHDEPVKVKNESLAPERPQYVDRKSIKSKIFTTISDYGLVMNVAEIAEKLKEIDPNIKDNLSAQLTILRKEEMLVNYSPTGSKKHTYWGIRNWRDQAGNFKPEYIPDSLKEE